MEWETGVRLRVAGEGGGRAPARLPPAAVGRGDAGVPPLRGGGRRRSRRERGGETGVGLGGAGAGSYRGALRWLAAAAGFLALV